MLRVLPALLAPTLTLSQLLPAHLAPLESTPAKNLKPAVIALRELTPLMLELKHAHLANWESIRLLAPLFVPTVQLENTQIQQELSPALTALSDNIPFLGLAPAYFARLELLLLLLGL